MLIGQMVSWFDITLFMKLTLATKNKTQPNQRKDASFWYITLQIAN